MKLGQILSLLGLLTLMSGCPLGGGGDSGTSSVCGADVQSCPANGDHHDQTEFSVTGSLPENLEKDVSVEGPFAIFLGDQIADYSVVHNTVLPGQENTLILKNTLSGEEVLVDVQIEGNELLIRPSLPLEGSSEYSLELTSGIESTEGIPLEDGHKVFFETQTTQGSSVAGETVVSWTAEHETDRPISHFILYYGADSAEETNSSGQTQIDANYDWAHERVIRPEGLDPELEGQRAYHVEFNNHDLPGLIPGTYNYFSMKACNDEACSVFSNQAEKYLE